MKKKFVAFLLVITMVSVFAIPSLAAGATGATGYYSVYNRNYSNFSYVYAGYTSGTAYASAITRAQTDPTTTSNKVPSGYMGAKARLYNSSDQLVASTSFIYNSKEDNTLNSDVASLNPAKSTEAYYSYGITAAYNGNGYSQYYTFKSPSQNP